MLAISASLLATYKIEDVSPDRFNSKTPSQDSNALEKQPVGRRRTRSKSRRRQGERNKNTTSATPTSSSAQERALSVPPRTTTNNNISSPEVKKVIAQWHLHHKCVGDTTAYHPASDMGVALIIVTRCIYDMNMSALATI